MLNNTSGHADKQGLADWLNAYKQKPKLVFVNHGTEEACGEFRDYLINEYGYNAAAPYSGTGYNLISGDVVVQTKGVRIKKQKGYKDPRAINVFKRLMDAVNRLTVVAKRCEGMSNKDIGKLTKQIDQLSDKWLK
jgi:metallo-beta-lactamase family protein